MQKILFSHSYFLRFDPKQWALGQPYAPLGTLYAASLLRENGFDVSLFDTMFAAAATELIPVVDDIRPDFFVIYDDGFNFLTKMCLTRMRDAAFDMIRLAKDRGCTVILSSSDSTDRHEEYLAAGADFILLGEAEHSLLELVGAISRVETDFTAIAGLAYRKNDTIQKTVARPVLKDLDSLPLPAWDLVNIEQYRSSWLQHAGYFSINMSTTRGCPFKCNWCAKPIYGNRYNARSPQKVVEELIQLTARYGFDHVWFCDDIFGLKPGWVRTFADELERRQLTLRFKIQSRADLICTEKDVADLARAGCENAWMGAESGSQKILDAMDKGTTVEQIAQATQLLKKYGIRPSFFIQFGYLGETAEDIELTIAMINKLLPFEIGISVSYPLPGTVFYEKVKSDLTTKTNWTDSNEMALMFRNTYQPSFYKQLYRYVHRNYRKHLAMDRLSSLLTHPVRSSGRDMKKALSLLFYAPATFISRQKLKGLQKPV